jgi:hypothetical protein
MLNRPQSGESDSLSNIVARASERLGYNASELGRRKLSGMKSVTAGVFIGLLFFSVSLHGQASAQSGATAPPAKASQTGSAGDSATPGSVALDAIRRNNKESLATKRWVFATGGGAQLVQMLRSQGFSDPPDANEMFRLVLQREAAQGNLMELYQRIIKENNCTVKPDKLFTEIVEAAKNDESRASFGDNKSLVLTPSLSLDAGYAEGLLTKPTLASLRIPDTPENVKQLKSIAEDCLEGGNPRATSSKTCYATGLALAAKYNSSAAMAAKPYQGSSTSDIARQGQQKLLDTMRKDDSASLATRRWVFATGGGTELVNNLRDLGVNETPDASEMFGLTLLSENARGNLYELYSRIIKENHGIVKPEQLVSEIVEAAKNDEPQVPIGDNKNLVLTPSLSLDAGYTDGLLTKLTLEFLRIPDTPENIKQLKVVAEDCLDGDNPRAPDLKTCFAAGLTLAAKNNSTAALAAKDAVSKPR